MGAESVVLDGVRSLNNVLERLPQGSQARALIEKLGLWSTASHTGIEERRKIFPTNFSRLSDPELSDWNAYWLSEVFRATELVGLLEGQKVLLTLEAKSMRASTRAKLRRGHEAAAEKKEAELREAGEKGAAAKVKPPAATQLADEVEEDQNVQDCDAVIGMLAVVHESAKAYKEACLAATAGLSREISFRQAQMGARLR